MSSIADCLAQAAGLQSVSDSPRLDVELLLCRVLDCSRTYLYTWPEKTVEEAALAAFKALLERRQQGEPVAYILGQREFWSLTLAVSPSTLIPRPDTECLVERALRLPLPERARVVDLGTGTGAIALALASEKPSWQVFGADISVEAIALAQRNADNNQLQRVAFCQSHWLQAFDGQVFDLIISNPPYIDADDPHLCQGDVRFEPASALVAEKSGMADLLSIMHQARSSLASGGWLLLEHGYQQAAQVREAMQQLGYVSVETCRDYGDNDRMTLGQWHNTSESV